MDYIYNIISRADEFATKFSFQMKTHDKEIAISLYNQMYELLIMSQKYIDAGDIALKAAKVLEIVDDDLETVELYRKAALAYIKTDDYERAIHIYNIIISKYENGIFHNPLAKYLENLADLYEGELQDQEAIVTYLKSYEQYNTLNKPYNVIKILNKVARLYINQGNVTEARDTYLKIINVCKNNNVHMFIFYDYLCTLFLCEFNIYAKSNIASLDEILKNKIEVYSGFNETREYLFLFKCINAFNNKDKNTFIQSVNEYNDLNKLDSIQVVLLDEIIRMLPNYV